MKKKLKNWISFIAGLAFVITTMASISHAFMVNTKDTKTVHIEQEYQGNSGHPDCHEPDEKKASDSPANSSANPLAKHCCDKNCKCLGNFCNGLAKILGFNGLNIFMPVIVKNQFILSYERAASDQDGRIKRPPRS